MDVFMRRKIVSEMLLHYVLVYGGISESLLCYLRLLKRCREWSCSTSSWSLLLLFLGRKILTMDFFMSRGNTPENDSPISDFCEVELVNHFLLLAATRDVWCGLMDLFGIRWLGMASLEDLINYFLV